MFAWHPPVAPPWPGLLHDGAGVGVVDPLELIPTHVGAGGAFLHPGDVRVTRAGLDALALVRVEADAQSVVMLPAFALGVPVGKGECGSIVVPRGRPILPELVGLGIVWPAGHVDAKVSGVDAFVIHVEQHEPVGGIAKVGLLSVDGPHLVSAEGPTGPAAGVEVDAVGAHALWPALLLCLAEVFVLGTAKDPHVVAEIIKQGGNLDPVLGWLVWADVLGGAPRGIHGGFVFKVVSSAVKETGMVPSTGIYYMIIIVA